MAAFILNFQGPQTVEDIEYCYDSNGSNMDILMRDTYALHCTEWTVPQNANEGDIAIFACARTAPDRLGHARVELRKTGDDVLLAYADEQMSIYRMYAGKMIAIGVISSVAEECTAWNLPMRSIVNLKILSRPIDLKELKDVVKLNRFGSVTCLDEMQWVRLKDYISRSEMEYQVQYMSDLSHYDNWDTTHKRTKRKRYKERNKMSSRLRYKVLKRDGFQCMLCGRTMRDGIKLEVDHIKPVSKGGLTEMSNLLTLCNECNSGKSDEWEQQA